MLPLFTAFPFLRQGNYYKLGQLGSDKQLELSEACVFDKDSDYGLVSLS